MKTNDKPISSKQRIISRCVLSALALLGAADAAANKQFADVPLYLQNERKSSSVAVKPNVMLLIDDSGSMRERVPDAGRSRLQVTKSALNAVLDKYTDSVNWGFQTLNNSSDMSGYTDNHETVKQHVGRLVAKGGTPTTRRYYEVSKLMRGQTQYRCQKNYIVLMSDGDANLSCDWNSRVNRAPGFESDRALYVPHTPFAYPKDEDDEGYFGLPQEAGYCARDQGGPYDTFWDQNNGLRFFSHKLLAKDFKTLGLDKAGKSWNGDAADPKDSSGKSRYEKQLIETFTVGFGSGISERGKTYLEHGAATSLNGGYFNATDSDGLVSAFSKIFANIEADNAPVAIEGAGSTAPALTNPGQSTSAGVVEVDSGTWSSRLKFYQINPNGSVNTAVFGEPSFGNRQTILNDGQKNYFIGSLTDKDKTNTDFGIGGGTPADQLEWKKVLLEWTARRGDDNSLKNTAIANNYSQPYRVRETVRRNLGDILDSSLHTVGDQVNGRNEFLVTAANDGMVHLFRSASGSNPYDLKVSYIPAGMDRDDDAGNATTMGKYLKDVAHEKYGKEIPHRYMVNGGIVVRRTAKSSDSSKTGQRSFLFGAMGQGGRGAYALNIGGVDRSDNSKVGLDGTSVLYSVPLFETAKGAGNTLGYTVGTPQIGRISVARPDGAVSLTENVRYAGFLSSGYRVKGEVEGKTNETALYVYDMLGQEADSGKTGGTAAGSLIRKIEVSDGVGGLSAPTLVDTDFDGVVDAAYAGDYGGNMYRFDLRGEKPADWKVARIYAGDAKQPVTAAPAVSRRSRNKYVVIFGTGSDIYQDDRNNTDQQAVYGIFDDLNAEAVAANSADLLLQTLSSGKVSIPDPEDKAKTIETDAYTLSSNKMPEGKKGWKIDLSAGGERVVVKPTMILRTAVITARKYKTETTKVSNNGDPCIPETTATATASSTMLLGVNAETGGQPDKRSGYVRFIKDNQAGKDYSYAGLRQPGIISFTFMDSTKRNDSPVTRDGDSGGSGTDQPLKAADTEVPNNKCFSREAVRVLLTNKGSSFDVDGRICGIRRLSWREIFF
ncbi:VWA domain-containing protein [Neisseria weixii]|uniref:VWA domain-containing protein n=1 Tax=Neisseria weixii TaxID=1853276 RepID=A0A3N4NUV6_9NEIS|nr:PilC family type IV pilus tip adhesin [Neisseria weixii]RPD90953.1 VWA domain-containing protein [Neisseria weixii]RPD91147.1 VWA domain-containing protein [Neisseria weixii]